MSLEKFLKKRRGKWKDVGCVYEGNRRTAECVGPKWAKTQLSRSLTRLFCRYVRTIISVLIKKLCLNIGYLFNPPMHISQVTNLCHQRSWSCWSCSSIFIHNSLPQRDPALGRNEYSPALAAHIIISKLTQTSNYATHFMDLCVDSFSQF